MQACRLRTQRHYHALLRGSAGQGHHIHVVALANLPERLAGERLPLGSSEHGPLGDRSDPLESVLVWNPSTLCDVPLQSRLVRSYYPSPQLP
eukprot:COSAG01_NODE_4223_length_5226_cov_15.609713_2_plen_92_part_00